MLGLIIQMCDLECTWPMRRASSDSTFRIEILFDHVLLFTKLLLSLQNILNPAENHEFTLTGVLIMKAEVTPTTTNGFPTKIAKWQFELRCHATTQFSAFKTFSIYETSRSKRYCQFSLSAEMNIPVPHRILTVLIPLK